MGKLGPIFESFFTSDAETIEDQKKIISKTSADKCLKESFEAIYEGIDSTISGENSMEKIMESFQKMVDGLDFYKSEGVEELEKLIVEAIDKFDPEKAQDDALALEYLMIKLEEAVEGSGASILLEEEELYKNIADLEAQNEEDMADPNPNPTESGAPSDGMMSGDAMSDTATSEATPGDVGESNPEVPIEESSKFEDGFEEGRKAYDALKAEGHNPRKYSQNIAETRMADLPYASVEQWRRGFEEGVKFQEKVLRETKPELFENENNEK